MDKPKSHNLQALDKKFEKDSLFSFYWKIFAHDNGSTVTFKNHELLKNYLEQLGDIYSVTKSTAEIEQKIEDPQEVFFAGIFPLDKQGDNYHYKRFMKFHIGFLQFSHWYAPNRFGKIKVDQVSIQNYVMKKFRECLHKEKRRLRGKEPVQADLIYSTCVRERLTAYNLLRDTPLGEERAREFLNAEYSKIMKSGRKARPSAFRQEELLEPYQNFTSLNE